MGGVIVKHDAGAFKMTSSVLALLCGSQPKGMGKNYSSALRCQIYASYVLEDFEHTLFVCETLQVIRQGLVKLIISLKLC